MSTPDLLRYALWCQRIGDLVDEKIVDRELLLMVADELETAQMQLACYDRCPIGMDGYESDPSVCSAGTCSRTECREGDRYRLERYYEQQLTEARMKIERLQNENDALSWRPGF